MDAVNEIADNRTFKAAQLTSEPIPAGRSSGAPPHTQFSAAGKSDGSARNATRVKRELRRTRNALL